MPNDDLNLDSGLIAPRQAKPTTSHLDQLSEFAKKFNLTMGSTTGGTHNRGSLHYSGNAFDVKNSGGFDNARVTALKQAASEFGLLVRDERTRPKGQKVWGGPHIHIEKAEGDDPLNLDAGLTVENLDAGYADTPTRPTSAASSRSAYNSVGRVAVNAPSPLDKLARDIEWHFGSDVVQSISTFPIEQQQEIVRLATEFAASDDAKKQRGEVIIRSPSWQALNQRRVGIRWPEISKADLEKPVYEAQRGQPTSNPTNIDLRVIKGEQPTDRLAYMHEGDLAGRSLETSTEVFETNRPFIGARNLSFTARASETLKELINKHAPGIASLDTQEGMTTAFPRGLASGVTLGAVGSGNTDTEQILPGVTRHALGEAIGALAPLLLAGKVLPTSLSPAARTSAMFGATSAGRQVVNAAEDRPVDISAPVVDAALGLVMGRLEGINPTMKRRIAAYVAPGLAFDLAQGATPEEAVHRAATNFIFAVTMGGKEGEKAPSREMPSETVLLRRAQEQFREQLKESKQWAETVRLVEKRNAELKKSTPLGTIPPEVKLPERPVYGPPPVPEGHTRFFRADHVDAKEPLGSGWVANDPEYVSHKHGKGQMGSETIWYRDVPNKELDADFGDHRAVGTTNSAALDRNGGTEARLYRRIRPSETSSAASDDALLDSLVEKKGNAAPVTPTEPPKFAGQEGSATLGASVLGANKFIQHDIAPIGRGAVDTVRSVVRLLSPKTGVKREAADLLMGMKGQRDKAEFIVTEQGRAARKMFDKLPTAENVAFMDRIKQGQTQPTPEMQTIADTYRPLEDDLNSEVRKFKLSATYLENHFRVFWKVVPGAQSANGFAGLFKRPLQGSKGFLKQHTLNTVSEGIARGGVPVSYNPQTLFEMNYADTMKFITAQRMWQGLKDAGLAKFVKTGRSIPDGFTRLSDPLVKVYFPTDAGLVNTGEWFVDEGAGRLLNNHLSRNYITEAAAGKGAMTIKNQMTQMELGFSLFHAAFVSSEAASSTLGLGMRRFVNLGILRGSPKEMLKGVGEIAKAPYAYFPSINVPISTYATGAKAFRYLVDKTDFLNTTHGRSFIKAFPEADTMLDDLFTGGGKLRMWEGYRTNTTESFKKAINDGNYPGALLRSLPALNETVIKPLFDVFIPRMKVGQFLQEYSLALQEKAPQLASGELTRPELARKTWNFVEDRFGEMNFDNLFWDNTFKSAMQLMWRSTTWKLGNLRATLGAIPEQGKEFRAAYKGSRAPQLEPKMAWLAGQSIVTALLGTVIMKMFTGKYPQTLTDLAFPQVDPNDPKRRLSVPTYVRDTVSLKHDPSSYVAGAASAEFSRAMESWKNRDFSGQQVYDPHDPAYWKAADTVKHFFPVPFSVSNYRKAVQEGRPTREQAAGFFGFMKAPAWLGKSQWELDVDEAAYKNVPQVGRTPEAMKRSQTKNLLIERRRQGDQTAMGDAYKLKNSKQLTDDDISEIRSAWHRTELQVKFGRMELEDAERIFPTMPPEAQKEVLPILEEKRHNRGLPRKGAAPTPIPVGGT